MTNNIDPTPAQFEQFKQLPRDQPILMLNLVRLREQATYTDGTTATGAEAYARYGKESGPIFSRVGGEIIWRGVPETVLIGPADEHWDIAFIARYENAGNFLAMIKDPNYQHAVVHRQAAVEDSRLIRLGETTQGKGFAQ